MRSLDVKSRRKAKLDKRHFILVKFSDSVTSKQVVCFTSDGKVYDDVVKENRAIKLESSSFSQSLSYISTYMQACQ